MFYLFFLLFILLCLALFFSVIRTGSFSTISKVFRIAVVVISSAVFIYLFTKRSLSSFKTDSLTVQVINQLPMPLDFYLIKVNDSLPSENQYQIEHLGKIRSNYFRIAYLDMKASDQFWLSGFMGKKNQVYFSQHAVPNKNVDQIIEVKNYINQSAKLSAIAKERITDSNLENVKASVWITLDLLLLFLNLALLFRKSKTKIPN